LLPAAFGFDGAEGLGAAAEEQLAIGVEAIAAGPLAEGARRGEGGSEVGAAGGADEGTELMVFREDVAENGAGEGEVLGREGGAEQGLTTVGRGPAGAAPPLLSATPVAAAAPPTAPTISSHFMAPRPVAAPAPAAAKLLIPMEALAVWPLAEAVTRSWYWPARRLA
jgi:hypothetical protein